MAQAVKEGGRWILYGLSTEDKDSVKAEMVKDPNAIVQFIEIDNYGRTYTEYQGQWYLWAGIEGELATVATSGSYNDLTNKPALKTVATSGSYNDLTNRPSLAAVATSGSYNDLIDKPSTGGGLVMDLSMTSTSYADLGTEIYTHLEQFVYANRLHSGYSHTYYQLTATGQTQMNNLCDVVAPVFSRGTPVLLKSDDYWMQVAFCDPYSLSISCAFNGYVETGSDIIYADLRIMLDIYMFSAVHYSGYVEAQ